MGKNAVKIGIIVVALGVAGVILATTSRTPTAEVVSDAKPIDLVCTKCNHAYKMPYDEFSKTRKDAAAKAAESSEDESGTRKTRKMAMVVVLSCPSCNEEAAVPANRCAKHSLVYPMMYPDGSRGFCPDCPRRGR